MIVDSYVLWRVTDPLKFAQTLSGSVTNAENRIDNIVYNATKNTISNMTQDAVILSRDGKMTDFKEGSMKIAVKSGCPIVPIAISNTANVFENHFPKLEAVPVVVEVLDPINPADYDNKEQKHLGKLCRDRIEEARDRNLERYCG